MAQALRILTVVGARPQFIKAAALGRAIAGKFAGRIEETLLHTGQHYDTSMSAVFFEELGLRTPAVCIGSTPESAAHLGRMMDGVGTYLANDRPDLMLVYGDTNSTLAGAMAARRMGVPVAHVEAGLRAYDNSMPEEENRVLVDHASTWLFCPTASASANLAAEGIAGEATRPLGARNPSVRLVGDVMLDNTLHYAAQARTRPVVERLGLRDRAYLVATVHRAGTADDPAVMQGLLAAFSGIHSATGSEVVMPMHPRTARTVAGLDGGVWPGVRIVPPMGYLDMLALVDASQGVLTDSGGLQKEACFLGKRCLILRDRTEWVELLGAGGSFLVGTDTERIVAEGRHLLEPYPAPAVDAFGDGHAAERICEELLRQA